MRLATHALLVVLTCLHQDGVVAMELKPSSGGLWSSPDGYFPEEEKEQDSTEDERRPSDELLHDDALSRMEAGRAPVSVSAASEDGSSSNSAEGVTNPASPHRLDIPISVAKPVEERQVGAKQESDVDGGLVSEQDKFLGTDAASSSWMSVLPSWAGGETAATEIEMPPVAISAEDAQSEVESKELAVLDTKHSPTQQEMVRGGPTETGSGCPWCCGGGGDAKEASKTQQSCGDCCCFSYCSAKDGGQYNSFPFCCCGGKVKENVDNSNVIRRLANQGDDFLKELIRLYPGRQITHISGNKIPGRGYIIIPNSEQEGRIEQLSDALHGEEQDLESEEQRPLIPSTWKWDKLDGRRTIDTPNNELLALAAAEEITLLDNSPVKCCGCIPTKARGRYEDQDWACTCEDLTCRSMLLTCCWRSCCCGCAALEWLTGCNRYIMVAGVVLFFAGFIALCVVDREWGLNKMF